MNTDTRPTCYGGRESNAACATCDLVNSCHAASIGLQVLTARVAEVVAEAKKTKHGHYFKDVSRLDTIDVYRVLELFGVTDPCVQHAVKKLLVAGGRGSKDMDKDIQEAIDTLLRWQAMRVEDRVEQI